MNIRFLGTGDAFTKYGHNSAILFFKGTNLMIDCPDSNFTKIETLEITYADIEHLFITHLHADHINGLEKFAYYKSIAAPHLPKTKLFVPKSITKNLWESLKHGLSVTTDGEKTLHDYFDVVEVETSFKINDQIFHIQQTKHVPGMESYGLYVENHLYFSGDSLVDENFLAKIEENVNLIFHDCHLWDLPIKSHASLDDIKQLSKNIQDKTILMHYQDEFQGKEKAGYFSLAQPTRIYKC